MSDNVTLNQNSTTGAVLATDDVSSVHYQKVKLTDGTDGSSTAIASGGGVESGALRVTIASDSTGVVSVDDNGGSLTIDGTVATTQSGTWTVQPGNTANTTPWLTSIHDGTTKATVRELGTNDALNVAIVDGSGNQITSFGGGTQYTEDVASASDPVGTQLIARRRDTLASETSADGDNVAVNATDKGELYVKHAEPVRSIIHDGTSQAMVSDLYGGGALNVAVVDADGTQITSFGGGTQYTEDAASAADPIGTQLIARRRDTLSPETSADGDVTALNATANGELYVKHVDAIPVSDNGSSLTVDNAALSVTGGGVESSALRVTIASDSTGVLSVDDNGTTLSIDDGAGSLTVDNAALSVTGGGVESSALRVTIASDSTGVLSVDDNGGSLTVDNAALSVTGGGVESSALRVTLASDSTGVLSVDDNGGSLTIDGTVAATQSSTWTVQPGNTPNTTPWLMSIHDGQTRASVSDLYGTTALNVALFNADGQQISHLPGALLDATNTAIGATVLDYTNANPLAVRLTDTNGDYITAGGGTQYTEGDTDASITGTALLWEDTSDTLRSVSAAKPLPVNVVAGGAGDGAILDGVSSSIKATVLDYTNSNPLAVRLTDTSGDYVGAGAGTQYTEDAASAADPIGTQLIARRRDTLSPETSADGDVTALNATANGELYVKHAEPVRAIVHDGTSQAKVSDLYSGGALNVAVVDGDGLQITSFGGTQYTEDAASAANPVGNQLIARRRDSLSGETTTDGDNVAVNSTDKGELYVKHVDTVPVTDNGGSLTVDNVALSVTGGGVESTALRVTIASDSTGVLSVDDNGSSLTVDNAGTFAVQATLAAGATTIAKAEDVASADADVGVPAMAIRKATPANTSGTDGDYEMLQISAGRLWTSATIDAALPAGTNVIGHAIIDSGSTTAVTQTTGTNLHMVVDSGTVTTITNVVQVADNASSLTIDNAALSVTGGGVESSALRVTLASDSTGLLSVDDNGSTLSVDDGAGSLTIDNATLSVTGGGVESSALRVTIANDSTGVLSVDDNGSSLTVDGTVATTQSGTWTVQPGDTPNTVPWLMSIHDGQTKARVSDLYGTTALNVAVYDADGNIVSLFGGPLTDGDNANIKATVFDYTNANPLSVRLTDTNGDYVSAGGGTQYTEDVASAADPVGTQLIARRRDSLSTETTTDGDNTAVNSTGKGELYVKHVDSIPVTDNGTTLSVDDGAGSLTIDNAALSVTGGGVESTALRVTIASDSTGVLSVDDNGGALTVDNAGTFAVQATIAAGATAIAKAEDVASANADVGVPAMAVQKATPANTAGTDGDYEFLQMSAGRLWTSATIDAALPAGTNAIGKLAANSGVDIGDVDVTTVGTITPGTAATSLGKAEDASHSTGDVGVMALAVRSNTAASTSGTDGDYQPLITNTTGHLWVDASGQTLTVGSHAVTNAGTFAVQVDGSALTALQLIDNSSVDHDAAVVAGVMQQGAAARTSDATAVANGDAVRTIADTLGKQVVLVGSVNDLRTSGVTNYTTGSAADVIAAAGAGVRIVVTSILVTNAHATVATKVSIRDGTTAKITGYAAANGGGYSYSAGGAPLFISTANTAVTAICGTTGADVDVSISGYTIIN